MKLSQKLKEIRLSYGLTQKELAEKIHVAPHTITQYETGKRKLNEDILVMIAEVLGSQVKFAKTEKSKGIGKDKEFYSKKSMLEFESLSHDELTDYIMHTQDLWFQFQVAGSLPWEVFRYEDFDRRYDEVINAVCQFPWEEFTESFLWEISKDSELNDINEYFSDFSFRTESKKHS